MRFLLAFATLATYAQQTSPATYDTARRITLQGAVTRVEWTYPRAYVFINVKESSGNVVNWAVDLGDLISIEGLGWKPLAAPIGEVVNVEGFPARGGAKRILRQSITGSGGRRLFQGLMGVPGGIPGGVRPTPAP